MKTAVGVDVYWCSLKFYDRRKFENDLSSNNRDEYLLCNKRFKLTPLKKSAVQEVKSNTNARVYERVCMQVCSCPDTVLSAKTVVII